MKRIVIFIVILITLFVSRVNAYNKSVVDVTKLTMSDAIEYLDKGVITSEELVNLYLDRINNYNDTYKAIITINPNIIEEAINSDKLRKEGQKRGILEGIPIIVKDNIDVVGMPTTAGAKALINNYPNEDADVIKSLKNEGAIIIAKANMSEFAFSAKDSYSSFGYVNNAYKVGYTSYGSSGGSAVSVALNFGSAALGTDTNSSVRLPAAASGLVGIRPTTGKLSSKGVINYDINRDTVGIITKSVLDNQILWGVLTGEKYEYVADETKKIKIGIPKNFYEGNGKEGFNINNVAFAPIKEMLDQEIKRLDKENVEIVYLDDVYTNTFARYNSLSVAGYTMCKAFNDYIVNTTGPIRSFNDLVKNKEKVTNLSGYYKACNYTKNYYNKTLNYLELAKAYMKDIYDKYELDFLLYPTTKNELYPKNNNYMLQNISGTMSSTVGYPALTLPLGYYDGLPYGIEIMGRENEEDKLYNMAYLMEEHNYLVNSQESSAPKLYETDEEVDNLVRLYINNYDQNEIWFNDVQKFFANYNNSINEKNITIDLINQFESLKKEKTVQVKRVEISHLVSEYFSSLFIALITLLIFLFFVVVTFKIFNKINKKY